MASAEVAPALPRTLWASLLHPWTWRMAWRDSRTQRHRLVIFSLAIVAGEESALRGEVPRRHRHESEPHQLFHTVGEAQWIDRTGKRGDADAITGSDSWRQGRGHVQKGRRAR